jgi:hypothetical protein
VHTILATQITPDTVMNMHISSIEGTPDMAKLGDLHEGAILYNIKQRYAKNDIYTYIGSILSAVNPYKKLEMFGDREIAAYNKRAIGDLPPHIYAIANEAYYNMWKSDHSQVVLISGMYAACVCGCFFIYVCVPVLIVVVATRRVRGGQDRVDEVHPQVHFALEQRGWRRHHARQAQLRRPAASQLSHPRGVRQRQGVLGC